MDEFFNKLEVSAWVGFIETQGRLFQKVEEDLRKHSGITHAEYEVLVRLAYFSDKHRMRIQDLAQTSLLTRSGMSRLVERLVKAGFIEREEAKEDGRGAYAVLTKKGRSHFNTAAKHHVALVKKEFLSHFTRSELEQMAQFWSRLK